VSRSGYVLVGGKSSRMGRNKALLPYRGGVLAGHIAGLVQEAAGSASLVGDPATYAGLGYPVVPDSRPGEGPLAGIEAALRHTTADWNLVVACDMPEISVEFLAQLLDVADASEPGAVIPVSGPERYPEPACAVYHRGALAAIAAALDRGTRKVTDGLDGVAITWWPVAQMRHLANVNTPAEWAGYGD
jgi:molybdopterin-guanine dinucleotide biosynthesis protein A